MRETIIAANWKMNGDSHHCQTFCQGLTAFCQENSLAANLVLFPAYPYLLTASRELGNQSGIALGAQSISQYQSGAYTGEISALMAKDSGCQYALIGHSERRTLFAETNEVIVEKAHQAIDSELRPMICIGESLAEREGQKTQAVLAAQIKPLLNDEKILQSGFVLAYEPVWAIGTGLAATPEQAEETHQYIRALLADCASELAEKTPILYGGSVKPENAKALFAGKNIDGALIGGASLNVQSFWDIATCTKS